MIKFLVFFVLGAATLYFIIRAFVNSEPGKVGRFLRVIFTAALIFGVIYFLFRGNLGFLAPLIGLARRLLVGF
ncbi:hypothetical protein OA854_00010 [Pelagibacteraceae bacterium]|nr:hypothetical protein [Pelagibacteraceae bacterium]